MIEISGTYNTAVVYTDTIESAAAGQIQKLVEQPFTKGSRIRIMPDVHAGAGCTIGTTMTITDKIVPNLVGVDIGCGMETVELKDKRLNLPELDSFIHRTIPGGFQIRKTPHKYVANIRLEELYCKDAVFQSRGELSLGTLGGGNHFIEVDKAEDSTLYLVVHSGSRNAGLQVAKYYQEKAYAQQKENDAIPYELAYCEGELMEQYLHDMQIMQEFADWNRRAIIDTILSGCHIKEESRFTTIHNYIDIPNRILRKGAVSAQAGEMLLIPINMRDGALICVGKGNAEWNFSAPHGSGRLMSRCEAKQTFSVGAYKKEMAGIFSTTVTNKTLDECPMAYKSKEEILQQITPTAEVLREIRPIYNFKAD